MRIVVVVMLVARLAAAESTYAGFVTVGAGELSGRVVDADGKPLRGAQVHVVSAAGKEQLATTDADGRYHATLAGGAYAIVYVIGAGGIGGQVAVTSGKGAAEVVEIHEALPPLKAALPKRDYAVIPPYTDSAMDHDVWTRAWLMLDISERGDVTHVKLPNSPGYDLDAGAIREAFALKFEPARDRSNQPTRSMLVWTFEWPSYWWMLEKKADIRRLPPDVITVRCRGKGPTRPRDRDCSEPDLAGAIARPWRDKP